MSAIIDARGLSCPEPVLLTREALLHHPNQPFTVLVSDPTPRENVGRLLTNRGRRFDVAPDGDGWRIVVAAQ